MKTLDRMRATYMLSVLFLHKSECAWNNGRKCDNKNTLLKVHVHSSFLDLITQ